MPERIWEVVEGGGPLIATAIHHGHEVRAEVGERLALSADERLREEDPYTGLLAEVAPTRLIGRRSRFEVDLNRPRAGAVYLAPEDAWGLRVWRAPPPPALVARSLAGYDAFYHEVERLLSAVSRSVGPFVVLDLHSYNHRRDGPEAPPADPDANPEVNVGTGSLDRERWGPLIDRFMADLSEAGVDGRPLDVRENVRFQGGHFPRWIHHAFPDTGCALAIEVKKTFMDEWTGEPYAGKLDALRRALEATVPGVLEELGRL